MAVRMASTLDAKQEEFPEVFVGLVTAVLVVEMALGLLFNVSVLVVGGGRMLGNSERGNTFLASLSVVDIVACLSALPLTLVTTRTSRFHDDLLLCVFFEGAVALSSTASSLTLLLISLERYHAVTKPTHRGLLSSRPALFLIIVWGLSLFTFSAPFYLFDFEIARETSGALPNNTFTFPSADIAQNFSFIDTSTSSIPANSALTLTTEATDNYSDPSNDLPASDFYDDLHEHVASPPPTTSSDDPCSLGVTCSCVFNSTRFFKVYEVVYVTAFFSTSLAMTMFCLAIVRVVRRRVAAKEAAATRQTNMRSATASSSRIALSQSKNNGSNSVKMTNTLEVPAATRNRSVSEERERETKGLENELKMYMTPHTLNPYSYTSVQEVGRLDVSQTTMREESFVLRDGISSSSCFNASRSIENHIEGVQVSTHTPRGDAGAPNNDSSTRIIGHAERNRSHVVRNNGPCERNTGQKEEPAGQTDKNFDRTERNFGQFERNNGHFGQIQQVLAHNQNISVRVQQNNELFRAGTVQFCDNDTADSSTRFGESSPGTTVQPEFLSRLREGSSRQGCPPMTPGPSLAGQSGQSEAPLAQGLETSLLGQSGQLEAPLAQGPGELLAGHSVQANSFQTDKPSVSALRPTLNAFTTQHNEQRVSFEESWVQRQQERQLKHQRRRRFGRQEEGGSMPPSVPGVAQERKVLRVSLVIAGVFLLCWGPHMIVTFLDMIVQDLVIESVHVVSLLLAYFTVVAHPLIYAFSRKQFREALSRPWRRYRVRRKTAAAVGVLRQTQTS